MRSAVNSVQGGLDPSVRRESRSRIFFFSVITLVLTAACVLFAGEFLVRILAPQELVSDVVAMDPDVDFRLRPNARGWMSAPEYSAEIRVNALGFRGKEISPNKPPGVKRVLFLGASFIFGHGLRENETLPYQVEQELNRRDSGTFEVVNGGVYGYATANDVALFKKFGAPLKPDVVVILVMTRNMADNLSHVELTPDGRLARKNAGSDYSASRRITRFIPGASWLRGHSHLFKFVGVRVLPVVKAGHTETPPNGPRSLDGLDSPTGQNSMDELSAEFYRAPRGAFQVTAALLGELARMAEANGVKPILLTLGGAPEFAQGRLPPERLLPHRKLKEAALEAGFAGALALSPVLAEYRGNDKLFFPADGHWTATATRFVAPAISDVVLKATEQK